MGIESKKLLLFASEFPPQPGGIGNHAWNLACELHRRGVMVRVIVEGRENGGDSERSFDAAAPFDVLRIPFAVVGIRQLRRTLLYTKQLRSWNPDFVIASGRFPLLLVAGVPADSVKVAVLHGTEAGAPGSLSRKTMLAALRRFATKIAVSDFTRGYFEFAADDPKVVVIPNGVSGDRFAGAEERGCEDDYAGSPLLVTVGNVTHRKGQDNVIRALPTLLKRYPNLVYHVAGLPTEREAFLRLARSLGVSDHVVFHGAVSEQELFCLLKAADVFMMLSASTESGDVEGFGIAILEANLLGVPAVGSRNCGIEDAIDHGKTGLLVDPADADAVAEAVHTVMLNRPSFSQQGQQWAAQHSWQAIGDRYVVTLVSHSTGEVS